MATIDLTLQDVRMKALDDALAAVRREYIRAIEKFPPFNSSHEGHAVIREEMDELWDDVKANAPAEQMKKEAIQIAAMAIRYVADVCEKLP
jgi:hypothetical protein